jgi:hypothetical protein
MKIKCLQCGVEAEEAEFQHGEGCEVPDLIRILANMDEVVVVFGREKLEAYGLLKSIDMIYEIANNRITGQAQNNP